MQVVLVVLLVVAAVLGCCWWWWYTWIYRPIQIPPRELLRPRHPHPPPHARKPMQSVDEELARKELNSNSNGEPPSEELQPLKLEHACPGQIYESKLNVEGV